MARLSLSSQISCSALRAIAWVYRPSGLEAPLPPALKEAGPARGLFWEQLLRSNGLVRATLTFLSWEEGRAGEGAGQPGDLSRTPTRVDEKGASGCFRVGSGNSALARLLTRELPALKRQDPATHFSALLKEGTPDSMEAGPGTLCGNLKSLLSTSFASCNFAGMTEGASQPWH